MRIPAVSRAICGIIPGSPVSVSETGFPVCQRDFHQITIIWMTKNFYWKAQIWTKNLSCLKLFLCLQWCNHVFNCWEMLCWGDGLCWVQQKLKLCKTWGVSRRTHRFQMVCKTKAQGCILISQWWAGKYTSNNGGLFPCRICSLNLWYPPGAAHWHRQMCLLRPSSPSFLAGRSGERIEKNGSFLNCATAIKQTNLFF